MNTIAEKLQEINEIKKELSSAINNKLDDSNKITNETPFSGYIDKLDSIQTSESVVTKNYYKCANTEQVSDKIIVTGAGTDACNGTYTLVDSTATGHNRVWKFGDYSIKWNDDTWNCWVLTPGGTAYFYFTSSATSAENPWDGVWMKDSGAEPVPTVTQAIWSGYKAIYTSGILSWDSTATSGLTYGNIIPVVGGVYDENATEQLTLNLLSDNIKSGVTILDISGTMTEGVDISDTTLTQNQVLCGYCFYNADGDKVSGQIADAISNNIGSEDIVVSFDSTSGIVTVSGNLFKLFSENTRNNSFQLSAETRTTITPSKNGESISKYNYLKGDIIISGDANLLAENIKEGVSIFGVSGEYDPKYNFFPDTIVVSNTNVIDGTYTVSDDTDSGTKMYTREHSGYKHCILKFDTGSQFWVIKSDAYLDLYICPSATNKNSAPLNYTWEYAIITGSDGEGLPIITY